MPFAREANVSPVLSHFYIMRVGDFSRITIASSTLEGRMSTAAAGGSGKAALTVVEPFPLYVHAFSGRKHVLPLLRVP